MEVVVEENHEAMSRIAAEQILNSIRQRKEFVIVAAAGSTPTRTYGMLGEEYRRSPELFAALVVIKLDEWCGMAMDDPATCETYMQQHLVGPLGIADDRYVRFDSSTQSPMLECDRVRAEVVQRSPVDLCVLGLGGNGHVGLNEPGDSSQPLAHVARLTEFTCSHVMLKNATVLPTHGMTLGLSEILQAKKILLVVSGSNKRAAVQTLMKEEVTPRFPASYLWQHDNVCVIGDREALQR